MARVKIEDVVDDLKTEMRRALEAAVEEVLPKAEFDRYALFRAFKRAVRRKCNTWERVPDNHVKTE
jgi:hypothetical protein